MADNKTLQTPRGVVVFPSLYRPDTKFDDNGMYKCDLRLDPSQPEVSKFLKTLEGIYRDFMGKPHPKNAERDNKKALWYAEVDPETEEPTGFVILKLRVKNKISKKTGEVWDRRPAQFDAKGKGIKVPKRVGGGSTLKVSFEVYEWNHANKKGISLQPLAVQIIELKEFTGQRDASAFGFGQEEGYVEGDDEDERTFENEGTDDDDYGDDDTPDDDDDDEADY